MSEKKAKNKEKASRIRDFLKVGAGVGIGALIGGGIVKLSAPPPPPGVKQVTFFTGQPGGLDPLVGMVMAELWKTYAQIHDHKSDGAIYNLMNLKRGYLTLAGGLTYQAYNGKDPFAEAIPLRTLMVLYPGFIQTVTLSGKGISNMSDLKGRKVSVGHTNSGTNWKARRILEVYGIDDSKDIVAQQLGLKESVKALRDGKIDAFFHSAGIPTPEIARLALTKKIELVPNGDAVSDLQKHSPIFQKMTIRKGTYTDQGADVDVVGYTNRLVTHADGMSNDEAYKLVNTFFDMQAKIGSIESTIRALFRDEVEIQAVKKAFPFKVEDQHPGWPDPPFHDGAIQFYMEKGVWKR